MNILFISARLPHARTRGGHGIVYQRIRRLSLRGHKIGLAVFASDDDKTHIDDIRSNLHALEIAPPPTRYRTQPSLWASLTHGRPYPFSNFYTPEMEKMIGDMVNHGCYDVTIAEYSVMGQYLYMNPWLPATRRIISIHRCYTVMSKKAFTIQRYTPHTAIEHLTSRGLRSYEFNVYRSADRLLTLTPEERYSMLQYRQDLRLTVIPRGVDTDYFRPPTLNKQEKAIVITGHYNDKPNNEAVVYFLKHVFPELRRRHPDLRFYVVGPSPSIDVRNIARRDTGIILTGEVSDVRPYLYKSMVFICPMRLGSGLQGKVLEAMACGLPVVSTQLGVEGIPIQMGDNALLSDTSDLMIENIDLLLNDPTLRMTLGARARQMVVERFDWDHAIDRLEQVLHDVVSR